MPVKPAFRTRRAKASKRDSASIDFYFLKLLWQGRVKMPVKPAFRTRRAGASKRDSAPIDFYF